MVPTYLFRAEVDLEQHAPHARERIVLQAVE